MKISKDRLNCIYDQYSNQENRLTHALIHTIGSSRWLFSKFLKDIVRVSELPARENYEISTQKVPFSHGDREAEEIESIPDAWIVDMSGNLGVAIEVKDKKNSLRLNQLRGHADRIADYRNRYLIVITPDLRGPDKIEELRREKQTSLNIVWKSWDQVYSWLAQLAGKRLSGRPMEAFLISSMLEYLERRNDVLGFRGIKFPHGFNVQDAKLILNSMMEELEETTRKYYPDLTKRRPAITTFSQESVWDCFGSDEGFTKDLHVTLSINEKAHDISITVPNSAKKAWKRLKEVFSDNKNQKELFSILKDLRDQVPHLFVEFNQRHFIAQRKGIRDGYMEFDIDTLGPPFRKRNSKVKEFPLWKHAIIDAVLHKKRINGQVMFKARFFLDEGNGIDKPEFIGTAKSTIKAFKPLYHFLRKS